MRKIYWNPSNVFVWGTSFDVYSKLKRATLRRNLPTTQNEVGKNGWVILHLKDLWSLFIHQKMSLKQNDSMRFETFSNNYAIRNIRSDLSGMENLAYETIHIIWYFWFSWFQLWTYKNSLEMDIAKTISSYNKQ